MSRPHIPKWYEGEAIHQTSATSGGAANIMGSTMLTGLLMAGLVHSYEPSQLAIDYRDYMIHQHESTFSQIQNMFTGAYDQYVPDFEVAIAHFYSHPSSTTRAVMKKNSKPYCMITCGTYMLILKRVISRIWQHFQSAPSHRDSLTMNDNVNNGVSGAVTQPAITLQSIQDHIPPYLTVEQKEALTKALSLFPTNTEYYLFGKYQNKLLQDGWTKLQRYDSKQEK